VQLLYFIKSMRPHQWIKNLLLFAAVIFSNNLFHADLLLTSVFAFVLFCGLSGSSYIINDFIDRDKDKGHPEKIKRPLASGKLNFTLALFGSAAILIASIGISFFINYRFAIITIIYLALNLLYSVFLKNFAIIDVLVIALLYVLRAVAGAEAIGVAISPWLLICTLLLSLFLAFGKRRHELTSLAANASDHRIILRDYSEKLLDQMIAIVTASTVIVYILYTVSDDVIAHFGTTNLVYTVPFVLYGIFRYLFLIHKRDLGGSPSKIFLNDRPLLITIMLWFLTVIAIIYLR